MNTTISQDQLREQLDTFIEECSENGVLQEIDDIWLGTDNRARSLILTLSPAKTER